MKLLLSIFVLVFLGGCGWLSRVASTVTGDSVSCIGGVEYIQFTSGASVKYKRDGTISTCPQD